MIAISAPWSVTISLHIQPGGTAAAVPRLVVDGGHAYPLDCYQTLVK
jgi:hypothetical protein